MPSRARKEKLRCEALVSPERPDCGTRTLAFYADKYRAAEKEGQAPIERARIVPAQVVKGRIGRTDERGGVRDGKSYVCRNRSLGPIRIGTGIDGRQAHWGGWAVEPLADAGTGALRKSSGRGVEKKVTI